MTPTLRRILIGKWSWKRPFTSLATIYGAFLVLALSCPDWMIFHPPKPSYGEDLSGFVWIPAGEGHRVAGLLLPAAEGAPTLLWSHGNAEDLGHVAPWLAWLHDEGFGVLAYDYPGYGLSRGQPTEDSVNAAANAAYAFLTSELALDPEQIVLAGQSVGTGPTAYLAAHHAHRAVVLLSPFLSALRAVTRVRLFPGDRFDNESRLARLETPLWIVHGTKDGVIPISQGRRLFEQSPASQKWFVEVDGAGHNDLLALASDRILKVLRQIAGH